MREGLYWFGGALAAAPLLYLGRDYVQGSVLLTWTTVFAGTTAAGVLLASLYRLQAELRASRRELQRKTAELGFAYEVQRALFPKRFPMDRGVEFAAACVPARGIGGDYYDVLELPEDRVGVVVADISGKGISAAILMANLQALLRTLAASCGSPAELGARLNHHLHETTGGSMFATFFYAEWRAGRGAGERRLRYVNAGHNPPLLLCGTGCRRLDEGCIPLGLFPEAEIRIGEATLGPGDLLVLYSDGVTERGAHTGDEFGDHRLEQLVAAHRDAPLKQIQTRVLEAVEGWSGGEVEDDMTLLLVRATDDPAEAR